MAKHSVRPYQASVVNESKELKARIDSLDEFIASDNFYSVSLDERTRLLAQLRHMMEYYKILQERIRAF